MMTTRKVSKAATEQAKSIVQSIIKDSDQEQLPPRGKLMSRKQPKAPPKSAWIRAYEQEMKDPPTNYGRGASREYNYFESSLMAHYVDDKERFFELVEQNPEVCAILYPDQTGRIQIIHHLTAAVHGQVIIVGVDGLGSLSEVKIVNIASLSKRVDLGVIDKEQMTPSYDDFLNNDIKEVPYGASGDATDKEGDRLEDFLSTCPVGYMIHPVWLNLIHGAIGRDPATVADILKKELTKAFEEGREGFNEYEKIGDYFQEVHLLFVYLWACHHGIVTVRQTGLLKSSSSQAFRDIQNPILQKIIQKNSSNKQVHYLEETPETNKTKATKSDHKRDSQVAKRMKRNDPSPSPPPSESPSPSPAPKERRRQRSEDRHRRRRDASPERSRRERRSRSNSERGSTSRSRSRSRSRRERSGSRDRSRRRSRSPPRFDPEMAYRLADSLIRKKGKTIASNLTPDQLRAFTLLLARDWNDERPNPTIGSSVNGQEIGLGYTICASDKKKLCGKQEKVN